MNNIYFIGIGGIGMSAIARFFLHENKNVAGYDRTPTALTHELEGSGVAITYKSEVEHIPERFRDKSNTLVIYTPAVSLSHPQLQYFISEGFRVVKRSAVLGEVTRGKFVMAVAGTHGKSSTTTMLAYFNHLASTEGTGSAFLGAISKNFNTNMVLGSGLRVAVEADEFDRSFLQLKPNVALITSVDADHLDIYGTAEELKRGFTEFTNGIVAGGTLIYREGIDLKVENNKINIMTYSASSPSSCFYAKDITLGDEGCYNFTFVTPTKEIRNCHLGIPGLVNLENCIGAAAMISVAGCYEDALREAFTSFRGLRRRFDVRFTSKDTIYIDDYAHHPSELASTLESVRAIYPERKITAVFQPHLFSRTRDFAEGFIDVLSRADEVILLPIYPAREEPISGVNSEMLLEGISIGDKVIKEKSELVNYLSDRELDILITFGAGDIDTVCGDVVEMLEL